MLEKAKLWLLTNNFQMQSKFTSLLIYNFVPCTINLLKQNVRFYVTNPSYSFIPPVNAVLQRRSYSMIEKMGQVKPPQPITKKQVSI